MTKRKIEYWVIPPEADAEFVASMEEVLETYEKPYNSACPVLCMDEQPVQLTKETRTPIPATKKILEKAGMTIDDIDLFEVNEAFASVVLAWQKETGADMSKVNVNGGAIALGHPLGSSGTKLMATLLNELERTGGRYGMQVMCEGGGMANATIIERLD